MLIDELISKVIPAFLDMMQKVLEDNGGKYIVGTDVSYKQLFTYIYIYIYILRFSHIINHQFITMY